MYYVNFDVFWSISLCLNDVLLTIVIKIQKKITKTRTIQKQNNNTYTANNLYYVVTNITIS